MRQRPAYPAQLSFLQALLVAAASVLTFSLAFCAEALEGKSWRAGVARTKITPSELMWLSGYGARDRPAEGTRHELWAKALVLEDGQGKRALLITADLVGIDRAMSQEVRSRLSGGGKLPATAIAIAVSHTHTGPVIGENLAPMYALDARQQALVNGYTEELIDKLVEVGETALGGMQPATLSWAVDRASFAVNRRNNEEAKVPELREASRLQGPVDHDAPVLMVKDQQGELAAIVAGYACHATVMSDYLWSGDWPGAAQLEIERRRPQATCLYWAGCGGDQNPLPRRDAALLEEYGRQFADAVDRAIASPAQTIEPNLETRYREIELKYAQTPTQIELQQQATGTGYEAMWAKWLLEKWDREGGLPESYPYPVQVWRLGDELTWVFLGGEVVVDYSLRIKQMLGRERTFVTGYANDVMNYIPSRRVLAEGGYEGSTAKFVYGLPGDWHADIESDLIETVRSLAQRPE